jgi:hypothetical protein
LENFEQGQGSMVTSSRYVTTANTTRCAFCSKPFRRNDGVLEFWRTSDGRHFCSEFCADDADEAQFQKHHGPQTSLGAGLIRSAPAAFVES